MIYFYVYIYECRQQVMHKPLLTTPRLMHSLPLETGRELDELPPPSELSFWLVSYGLELSLWPF